MILAQPMPKTRTVEMTCLRSQLDRLTDALNAAAYVVDYWTDAEGRGQRVRVEILALDEPATDTTIRNRIRIAAGLL